MGVLDTRYVASARAIGRLSHLTDTEEDGRLLDWNRLRSLPWPEASDEQRAKIRLLGQAVLNGAEFPNSTLADLYDVDVMPHQLRKAHQDRPVACP